ncbi:MAG: SRPBCC family protein [Actinomycetia bacterium]|nr:SRPBCC family protein [Actinomycetes bacterium]
MKNFKTERSVQAPRSSVWAVLADYQNIADWNDGVVKSRPIGDATEGLGAQRHVELEGSVSMRETVTEWAPEEKMVITIDQMKKVPVKEATMTFTLSDGGDATPTTMSYDFEPKGGPFGFVVVAMLGRPMSKGFNGFIDCLERAARARSAA